jgi:hypothetical protein
MNRILIALVLGLGAASTAQAVPWCHRGHIQSVATYHLDGPALIGFAAAEGISDPYWAASYAAHQTCQVHAGWTGPSFGVPGAGQVLGLPTAPSQLLSGNGYSMSMGVTFRCDKCFPLKVVRAVREDFVRE